MLAWYGHHIPNETSTIWNKFNAGLQDLILERIILNTSALNLRPLKYRREINNLVFFFKSLYMNIYERQTFSIMYRFAFVPYR